MKTNCTAVSIVLSLVSALTVCAQGNPEVAPRAIPVNTGPNDVARFLAGMPVPENSSLAPLTREHVLPLARVNHVGHLDAGPV